MYMEKRSKETMYTKGVSLIESRIRRVFNRDFFSIYDGIVEGIDLDNGLLTVRIPDLNDASFENCKIMLPCSSESSIIYPNFKINSTVIVGFKQFNLGQPIVLGAALTQPLSIPMNLNTVGLVDGDCKITLNNNEITITNGTSTLIISDSGITMTGPFISANGEDLSEDETGDD